MEQFKYSTTDENTRRDMLEAEAIHIIKDEKYDRRLSDSEIEDRRAESLKILDQQDELADEKKAVMDEFRAKGSALSKKLGTLRMEAKTGITTEVGKLYHIPDYDNRKVGEYNEHGELVNIRTMKPEERQRNMFIATGTEG